MFPLIAIAGFFILGIAFFAIGKDDFGIKKVEEVSDKTSSEENTGLSNESVLEKNSNINSSDQIIS
tara:strand:+ start:405 stop:602 length:198 start_codon:yes stop_codon:yes gene_type:complete